MENETQTSPVENTEPNKDQPPTPKSDKNKIYAGVGILFVIIIGVFIAIKYKPSGNVNQPEVNNTNKESNPSLSEYDAALNNIPNYQVVKKAYNLNLSEQQKKFLNDNRFLLLDGASTSGNNFDEMLKEFDAIGGSSLDYERSPENTKLVTPDIVLHAYHKFFEMTLEKLEQKELAQSLGDFLNSLQSNLLAAAKKTTGYPKQRYQNLLAQLTLAKVLFENKSPAKPDYFSDPDQEAAYNQKDQTTDSIENAKTILSKYTSGLTPDLITKIQQDLESIYKAAGVGVSPLFGQYSDTLKTDYTQFTPRSHYAKNSALRAYFRTMMYLGRSSYFLQNDVGIADSNLLVAQFKVKSQTGITPFDPWQKIMAVTGFYAGQSDDLTYTEWQEFKTKVLGSFSTDSDLTSAVNIQKMSGSLNELRLPKILSDVVVDENIASQTKNDLLRKSLAFRIFGQRFTFDAWVLNSLTAGQEKTDVKLPSTPSALFISSALGDAQAQKHAEEFLQKDSGFSSSEVEGFLTKLSQKKLDLSKITKDEWFASMGSAWLYVLGSLTHTYDATYPKYMQALPFLDKQIQTFLGSYTELKHDTLLYAKQSYAEMGGGGDGETPPVPPVVKGFVEPNIDFWNRFNELVANTQQVFQKNNLFSDSEVSARLKEFQGICNFYSSIANKEMQGQPVSEDDYERLRTTKLSFMVLPFESGIESDKNSGKVALIADVHTDGLKGQILYEADAKPYLMLAIVDNENSPRVVLSLVYNHYEFTGPLGGQRYTDEDWKGWVYDHADKLPEKNFWYNSLLPK